MLAGGCMLVAGHAFSQLNEQAAHALIARVLPAEAGHFVVSYIPPEKGEDVFELESKHGKILLRGSNGVSVASAFYFYLKNYCHCNISWDGSNLRVSHPLPLVPQRVHKVSPYKYRYYLNYCTFNYSMSWWGWKRWQWEIDWMAMHGINMPLALTGQNEIWYKVYRSLGFTAADLKGFFSGPAYFNWFWMGNLDGWDGPLPRDWMTSHVILQKQILARERSLGMTPVLPAFTGHVPPSFHIRYPEAKLKKTNWGAGFADVNILDPSDPMFQLIGKKFIAEEIKTFGTDHLYSADTFNENVPPTSDSTFLDGVSKKVLSAMTAVDPDAIWVMQGWLFLNDSKYWKPTQIRALLNAVPDNRMIILDLWSETTPVWNKTDAYYGKPWIWCMLLNFGGNISLFGRMDQVAGGPAAALHDSLAGKLTGIGLTPEGIGQNPVMYELMMANTWRDKAIDLNSWLKAYAWSRYGKKDPLAEQAWGVLRNTVYRADRGEGGPESILTARPCFARNANWTYTHLSYRPQDLLPAWDDLMAASRNLGAADGFRYDLVDLTRQVLANYADTLQQQFSQAYLNKDTMAFHHYSHEFLALLDDMDRLLATRKEFLLGRWIDQAKSWGTTLAEKQLYEKNARDLVTLWGGKNSPLHEYACKQWSGLIKGFYRPRWVKFFSYVDSCMSANAPVDVKSFDRRIRDWEWHWVNSHNRYPSAVRGDALAVSRELYHKYDPMLKALYTH